MTRDERDGLVVGDHVTCNSDNVNYFSSGCEYRVSEVNDNDTPVLRDRDGDTSRVLERSYSDFDVVKRLPREAQSILSQDTSPQQKQGVLMDVKEQFDKNKTAAIMAAKLTAGKALNTKALKLITPKLPFWAKGAVEHPLASVALANIVGIAIQQYAGDNTKAAQVADLMLDASAVQALEAFNVDEMLEGLLDGIKLPTAEITDGKDA